MGADRAQVGFGAADGGIYVSLAGRATQRTCPTVDRLVGDYLATQPKPPRITINLGGCGWVDSTFAGWLVGLKRRLDRYPGSVLRLAQCSERCVTSLNRMHLASLFEIGDFPPPSDLRQVECVTTDKPTREDLKLMLRAHEDLAGLSGENAAVFTPVAEMLRRQLADPS